MVSTLDPMDRMVDSRLVEVASGRRLLTGLVES